MQIPNILSSCQISILIPILEYNIINYLNILLNNFKKNINLKILKNSKKEIKLVDIISNNNKNSRFADID